LKLNQAAANRPACCQREAVPARHTREQRYARPEHGGDERDGQLANASL
jgi:hypothetical protein